VTDAIVVRNAGSSRIKFSHFVDGGETLGLDLHGQVDGLPMGTRCGTIDPGVIP
jgi:acetate kinase